MSPTAIAFVDIRSFAHATEDLDRVVKAIQRILPGRYIDDVVFRSRSLRGHHGNPIQLLETRIKKKEVITSFVEGLASNLSALDKETLRREIDSYVDKGSLYLRLDKQAAHQGEHRLSAVDPIWIRIRFRKGKLEDLVKACQEAGLLP